MKPRSEYITITDNKNRIIKLLQELVLDPRIKALEWSKITKQTPSHNPQLHTTQSFQKS
jgi:hypothetical protein